MVAVSYGFREAFAHMPGRPVTRLLQMVTAFTAGMCGTAASILLPADHAETHLLWTASAFFICTIATCALVDRLARQTRL
ncbi:MAG: hypothetical protein JWN52_4469 [Actinomycetia bacterium]|nr:hypothetical protein [Actinomycetes bacterium]